MRLSRRHAKSKKLHNGRSDMPSELALRAHFLKAYVDSGYGRRATLVWQRLIRRTSLLLPRSTSLGSMIGSQEHHLLRLAYRAFRVCNQKLPEFANSIENWENTIACFRQLQKAGDCKILSYTSVSGFA